MKTVSKITHGYVCQVYDADTGKCVGQRFVAGDEVEWEDGNGKPISPQENCFYQSFYMECIN